MSNKVKYNLKSVHAAVLTETVLPFGDQQWIFG